jgi:hypothetical protein
MANVGNIYGENVSSRIVDEVLKRADNDLALFQTEEVRLKLAP